LGNAESYIEKEPSLFFLHSDWFFLSNSILNSLK
jgi:hypothetical protein